MKKSFILAELLCFPMHMSVVMAWSSYLYHHNWLKPSLSLVHVPLFSTTCTTSTPNHTSDKNSDVNSNRNSELKNESLRALYPPATLSRNGTIQLDDIHSLFYEVYNEEDDSSTAPTAPTATPTGTINKINTQKKEKKTALFLHGGPGSGCFPNHARFFHPDYYRVVLFDQRGCGRSTPRGEIENNTLYHLVHDIEQLKHHIFKNDSEYDINGDSSSWDVVFGGSWGTTLALAYAQTFPQSVKSIVLRGAFLMRTPEINWMFGSCSDSSTNHTDVEYGDELCQSVNSVACMAPGEEWDEFKDAVSMEKDEADINSFRNRDNEHIGQRNVLHRYYDCLLGGDPFIRACAAQGWHRWEMRVSSFLGSNGTSTTTTTRREESIGGADDDVLYWNLTQGGGWSLLSTNRTSNSCHDRIIQQERSLLSQHELMNVVQTFRRWSSKPHETIKTADSVTTGNVKNQVRSDSVSSIQRQQQSIRPIQSVTNFKHQPQNIPTKIDIRKFIPAQAMITCYYSVNNEIIMSNFPLLSNIDRIRHIPCVTISGGNDLICPTDTALDLHHVWPEMNLRLVCHGKHSMYDPPITSEIIKVMDHLAGITIY